MPVVEFVEKLAVEPVTVTAVVAAKISNHTISPAAKVTAGVVIVMGNAVFVAVIVTDAEAWRPISCAKVVAFAFARNNIAVKVHVWSPDVRAVSRAATTATVNVPALSVNPSVLNGTSVVGSDGTNPQPMPDAVPTAFSVPMVADASGDK